MSDITYCINQECKKKDKCARYVYGFNSHTHKNLSLITGCKDYSLFARKKCDYGQDYCCEDCEICKEQK